MKGEEQPISRSAPSADRSRPARGRRRSPFDLDSIDRAIIDQLREDGRRPYGRIAAMVGLSEAATRQRVQRLLENEVLKIVAVTDPVVSGSRLGATIGLRTDGDLFEVADAVAAISEVDFVVITAGSFDLLIELQCSDDSHLLTILNDQIRTLAGVRSTETFIYLRMHKQAYAWPPGNVGSSHDQRRS